MRRLTITRIETLERKADKLLGDKVRYPIVAMTLSRQLYRDAAGKLRWGARDRTLYIVGDYPDKLDERLAPFRDFEGLLPDIPEVRAVIADFNAEFASS